MKQTPYLRGRILVRAALASALGLWISAAAGQTITVIHPKAFALSKPMRDLAPVYNTDGPAQQVSAPTGSGLALLLNVAGTPGSSFVYPDSNGAPGATQYMQWTNARYEIYNKTNGKKVLGPLAAKELWASLGGQCATTNAGDGIVDYDKAAQRWVVTHHTLDGAPYMQCVAVSTTSDATGSYYLYAFELNSEYYTDYPQLGVWPDAYYVTVNLLTNTGFNNVTGEVCALNRADMLVGSPAATAQCAEMTTNTEFSVFQPADLDGATAPPAGTPNYLMALDNNSIDLYEFHVNWTTPSETTFTFKTHFPVDAFTETCDGGYCVPQLGTATVLDGVGDRLLHRLAYRNFGTYDDLVITHSVMNGTTGSGVRWYEIRSPATATSVYQQGTIAPDANWRWLGSVAMDHNGDMAIGYSISSATTYPAINATGRLVTDPLGTMETEFTIYSGTGSQTGSGNDWGNASSMSIDPVDDCTFWYTNEYLETTGTVWETRLATLKFPSCP